MVLLGVGGEFLAAWIPENIEDKILWLVVVTLFWVSVWMFARCCSLRTEIRKLEKESSEKPKFHRQVYWFDNDPIPICPHCYENNQVTLHLTGLHQIWDNPDCVAWLCESCKHQFTGNPDEDFKKSKKQM